MAEPDFPPDPDLDAMLAQTAALRRRYANATAAEAPSAAADARIRAVAWHAVDATPPAPGSIWWRRLRVPVSIAAVLVLTTSAMLAMLRDTGERSLVDPLPNRAKGPAAMSPAAMPGDSTPAGPMADQKVAPPAPSSLLPQREESAVGKRLPRASRMPREPDLGLHDYRQSRDSTAVPADNANAAQPSAKAELPAAAVGAIPPATPAPAEERARTATGAVAGPPSAARSQADAVAPAAPPLPMAKSLRREARELDTQSAAARAQERAEALQSLSKLFRSDPGAWLGFIRRLWQSGAREDAIRQMATFHEAYPTYPVPQDFPVRAPTDEDKR